jgi:hypothetical protein
MLHDMWKTQIAPVLDGAARDFADLGREAKRFFIGLDTNEKVTLVCLLLIGLFVLMLNHFQRRDDGERATGRFATTLFVIALVAVSFGLMASGDSA